MRMPFGRHKGTQLRAIPHGYLQWVLRVPDISIDLRRAIEQVLRPQDDLQTLELEVKQLKEKIGELEDEIGYREFLLEEKEERIVALSKTSPSLHWWGNWFNRAVMVCHPDRGGNEQAMTLLNEANEKVKSA